MAEPESGGWIGSLSGVRKGHLHQAAASVPAVGGEHLCPGRPDTQILLQFTGAINYWQKEISQLSSAG